VNGRARRLAAKALFRECAIACRDGSVSKRGFASAGAKPSIARPALNLEETPMKVIAPIAMSLCALLAANAAGQDTQYPRKPITLVVPQTPGGANDVIARMVAHRLSRQIGQAVIVENRPGAGGNIGTASVAKAAPDGHTLLLTVSSAHVINPSLYRKPGFDPIRDFVPVATLATAGYVLVANPAFGAGNVRELIQTAASHPGTVMFASAGNGTLNHLIAEMLQQRAGIKLVHVPYKGAAPAVQDVAGGQVSLSVQSLPSSLAFIKAGRLKVLAVTNEKRVAALPDVPTVGETLKGFGATPWYAMFAPVGTPAPVVARLRAELAKVLDSAELRAQLAEQGCEVFRSTPQQFETLLREELPRWAAIVRDSGATLD
jgi:tripartite-type tricarboxylate transporter receptor subunit TctC